jgi:putative ABC transport system permease protein
VVRQLLTESGLLSLLGGAAGLLLSYWLVRAVIAFGPRNIPRLGEAGIDATVLAFTLGASVVTAALFGLAPAWQTFNLDLEASLREGGRGASSGRWHKRLSSGLVVAEVALAFLLLVGGGLLFQSFLRLRGTPLGFQPENVVSMSIQLPQATYPDRARRVQFFAELQREAAGLPGVRSASLIDSLPLGSDRQGTSFAIEGKPEPPPGQEQSTNFGLITPGYFETMGISIRRGRDFSSGDTAESPPVVIINERLARQYFPGEEPNGRRLRLGFRGQIFHQIVGVVADERHVRPEADFRPNVYLPYAQSPQRSALTLVLRSETDAATVVAGVSARLRELDPGLPLFDVRTLDRVVSESLAQPRLSAFLFSFFSLVAMGLAAVGIYGVVSYSVSQRFPEFGIRMALGASSRHIFRMILGQGAGLGLVGVVFGLAGALPLSRYLSSLLFEVSPTDPLTFSAIALFLMGVALVACWVPARRASKVEPGISLRYE